MAIKKQRCDPQQFWTAVKMFCWFQNRKIKSQHWNQYIFDYMFAKYSFCQLVNSNATQYCKWHTYYLQWGVWVHFNIVYLAWVGAFASRGKNTQVDNKHIKRCSISLASVKCKRKPLCDITSHLLKGPK